MKKWAVRAITFLLAVMLLLGLVMPAFATEVETTATEAETPAPDSQARKISTVEDLMAIEEDPDGSYLLTKDLDMEGIEWKPIDFSGRFDGGGHAILNLTVNQTSGTTAEVHDGNRKAYQAQAAGMFGLLHDASVTNLKLLNVRGVVDVDVPCYMGGIAGHSINSIITGCTVLGTLELRAHEAIFGLGGMIGYGSGTVEGCDVDVTLICVDTDAETKDEQFLGGVYSHGFIHVRNTTVKIQGFVSEHGYSHNGGITGLLQQNPLGMGKACDISNNTVNGKIKFFEDNLDRRAYCDAFTGEILAASYIMYNNLRYFQREEVWKYDQELRPCMCEGAEYDDYPVGSDCERYGHRVNECYGCGYQDRYGYQHLDHPVTNWVLVEEPTLRTEGLSEGQCDRCGITIQRKEPVVVPEETEPQPTETTAPVIVEEEVPVAQHEIQGKISILFLILAIATVLLTVVAVFVAREFRKR